MPRSYLSEGGNNTPVNIYTIDDNGNISQEYANVNVYEVVEDEYIYYRFSDKNQPSLLSEVLFLVHESNNSICQNPTGFISKLENITSNLNPLIPSIAGGVVLVTRQQITRPDLYVASYDLHGIFIKSKNTDEDLVFFSMAATGKYAFNQYLVSNFTGFPEIKPSSTSLKYIYVLNDNGTITNVFTTGKKLVTETSQAILFYGVRVGLSDSTISDRGKLIFVSSPGAFGFYQSPVGFVSRAARDFEQETMFFNELVLVSNSRLPSGTTFEINENSIIFKNNSIIDYYIYMASSYADTNTGQKNIATYASQAFKLYNDFVNDRSASIIKMTEDIRTGIISTGAINSEGNKISILVSNFVPDTTLTDSNGINKLPADVKINRQYYAIKQFQRLDYWLGDDSYDNLSLGYKNATTEPTLSAFPNFSNTTADFGYDQKSLADTESGFTITLNDIDISYENYSVTARYVYQGGTLLTSDGYLIESAIEEIPNNIINGGKSLRFTPRNDIMSKRYTVCLIEIYLN